LGAYAPPNKYKKLSYRRVTARCVLSVVILPITTQVKKGKVFPYSLPSVGPGADPGVQAVSPQVTK